MRLRSSASREFVRGVVAALPIVAAVAPVAMVFGTLCIGRGISATDTIFMSAWMYAGASQFVAVDLIATDVPAWSVVLSVFAVNFRHLLYSASITPLIRAFPWRVKVPVFFVLVDPAFAFAQKDGARGTGGGLSVPAYLGLGLVLWLAWVGATAVGATFGQLITDPHAFALDMLMPIYFLALVMGFRGRPNWRLTVGVSAAVSALVYHAPALGLTALGPPWHVTIGGLAGVLAAALATPPDRAVPLAVEPDGRAKLASRTDGVAGPAAP